MTTHSWLPYFLICVGLVLISSWAVSVLIKPPRLVCNGPPVAEVLAELDAGCPGTLVFESADGQCLRMWQMPHRMEMWLEGQKGIRIEDMYYFDHRTAGEPASIRYYVRYQVLKEK